MLQAELKVLGGKQAGKSIALGKKFLVGRESDCHLRPNSDMVSRHHCVFTLDDYTLRVRDYAKDIDPKKKDFIIIRRVNCFTNYDENTIPELDAYIL